LLLLILPIVLNKSSENRHPCLFADPIGNNLEFPTFSVIVFRYITSISYFLRIFIKKEFDSLSNAFPDRLIHKYMGFLVLLVWTNVLMLTRQALSHSVSLHWVIYRTFNPSFCLCDKFHMSVWIYGIIHACLAYITYNHDI
jgi:hypothetical protein